MSQLPLIKGESILLRRPAETDIKDRYNCGWNEEIIRMYGGSTKNIKPFTQEDAEKFVERIRLNKNEWCVEYEGRCIGQARLTVDKTDNRARYAVGFFDPSVLGKGLGTEVTQLILHYAFRGLKLHRVDLRVLEYNKRAIACYKKCGFIEEGKEREGALINGNYESDVMMSILDREYEAPKHKFIEVIQIKQWP
ncbi:GNAT family N-acetyltransferase [Evansella clarkii]|jgi:RimJ/RimL family protein N-acetyltransferase|uniref:GNAT family N-acetyltransferase n=1 Tax=Evansella clarkii TaxID=79879 RepID=UPI0009982373|nr:GNAT family protein [Evansella clarkii]